eukprot:10630645-Lingulodinium_polyedra.AAC.1
MGPRGFLGAERCCCRRRCSGLEGGKRQGPWDLSHCCRSGSRTLRAAAGARSKAHSRAAARPGRGDASA